MRIETKAEGTVAETPAVGERGANFFASRMALLVLVAIVAIVHNLPRKFIPDPFNRLLIIIASTIILIPKLLSIPKHILAVLLLTVGLGSMYLVEPDKFRLGWPSVVLLGGIAFLFFLPEAGHLPEYIERLTLKNLGEVVFKVNDLNKAVELAESVPQPAKDSLFSDMSVLAPSPDTKIEEDIIAVASRDKRSALVRLALEIEKEIAVLYSANGLKEKKPTVNCTVMRRGLRDNSIITQEVSNAIREFWRVRNKVVNPEIGSPRVPDSALGSTVDSGVRILRLLKEIPRPAIPGVST